MKLRYNVLVDKILLKTEPISVNRLYRGRRFLTVEGKEVKENMGLEAKLQWRKAIMEGPVNIEIDFYFKNSRMDIDNALKALFDCLTGVIWKDDKQIVRLQATKKVDKINPRIELKIT